MGSLFCEVFRLTTMFKIALALFALVAVASANKIQSVQVYTANCYFCGMNPTGRISLRVTGYQGRTCNTGILDNIGQDDFNRGTISTFQGSSLGECHNFDLASTSFYDIHMKLTHSGVDGGKFDWVQVFTDNGRYECYFSKKLDSNDSEDGHGCQYFRF